MQETEEHSINSPLLQKRKQNLFSNILSFVKLCCAVQIHGHDYEFYSKPTSQFLDQSLTLETPIYISISHLFTPCKASNSPKNSIFLEFCGGKGTCRAEAKIRLSIYWIILKMAKRMTRNLTVGASAMEKVTMLKILIRKIRPLLRPSLLSNGLGVTGKLASSPFRV